MFADNAVKWKQGPVLASLIECVLRFPLWPTPTCSVCGTSPGLMNIIWCKHSYPAFHLELATAAQAASFSAPIFNTAMRPLIMQGFK